jgi:hypothetical protein
MTTPGNQNPFDTAAKRHVSNTCRIQVGINLFFPGPTGESDEAVKLRERACRSVYEMAAAECGLVQQVLAKTCRLESVNLNLSRQPSGQTDGYTANGTFSLRITLK